MIRINPPRAYKVLGVQVLNSIRQPIRTTPPPTPRAPGRAKIRRIKPVWYHTTRGLQIRTPKKDRRYRHA